MSATATGMAGSLSTGVTNGAATVRVIPAPKLAINLKASPYRLGGIGFGTSGNPNFPSGPLTISRAPGSALPEIKDPTGWFYLTVANQGSTAANFSVSVTQGGVAITLPCSAPSSLAASGQVGDIFACTFPRAFNLTQAYSLVATANATNAIIVAGQQPAVTVTTNTCGGGTPVVVPNLVDTLAPTADGTGKTVGQSKALWTAAGFTGAVTTSPAGAANAMTSITQSVTAYSCAKANATVTVGAQ